MTKHEQAAKMRTDGRSVAEIAEHFGWSLKTTSEMISRGKRPEAFREKHQLNSKMHYARHYAKRTTSFPPRP